MHFGNAHVIIVHCSAPQAESLRASSFLFHFTGSVMLLCMIGCLHKVTKAGVAETVTNACCDALVCLRTEETRSGPEGVCSLVTSICIRTVTRVLCNCLCSGPDLVAWAHPARLGLHDLSHCPCGADTRGNMGTAPSTHPDSHATPMLSLANIRNAELPSGIA